MAKKDKLTARQEKYLLALLTEDNAKAAAKAVGISVQTGVNYRKNPLFIKAYKEMRRSLVSETTGRMVYLSMKATQALESVLDDPEASHYNKILASQIILDRAYKGMEIEDLAERIESLEALQWD